MGDDSPSNIFDFAAEGGKKKPSKEGGKRVRSRSLSSPADVTRWQKEGKAELEELEHLFSAAKTRYEEFNKAMDAMCKPAGLTNDDFKAYYEDRGNFSDEQWEDLQKSRKQMEAEIAEISKKSDVEGGAISASKKGVSKNRKGKTLGARKRWMNMR